MFPVSRRVPLDSVVSLLAVAVRNDLAWYTPTRRVSRRATVSPVAARYNVLKLHGLWLRAPRASAYRKKSCKGYGSAREIIENASRDSSKREHQRGRRDHASRSDARAPRIIDGGTVAGLTDGQLLERFASHRGAEAELAFTALVMRHGPLVFGVCQSLLRNPHDAEDAFQATFMVLARKAGSIRQPDRLGPWLHGVAHRTARRLKDKNARRKSHEAEAAVYSDRAHRSNGSSQHPYALANQDEIEALHREIERLPARYKTAIVLCDLQGLTHEEAARRLGRRVGTISSQVSRARERLRRRLDRRGLAYPGGIVAAAIDSTRPSVLPNALVGSTVKNVMSLSTGLAAGSVPVSIVSLSQGVLRSMLFAKIGLIAAAVVGLGAAATGVGVGVGVVGRAPQPAPHNSPRPSAARPIRSPSRSPPPQRPTEGRRRTRPRDGIDRPQRNELETDRHGDSCVSRGQQPQLPGRGDRGPNGTPLLSWRVAILPYLGESEKALYGQFKLSEPWDSPHNKALLAKMPRVYAPAVAKGGEKDKNVTHYLGFVGGAPSSSAIEW